VLEADVSSRTGLQTGGGLKCWRLAVDNPPVRDKFYHERKFSVDNINLPAQALNPSVQALNPSAQALSPPVQALSPPAQALSPPVQALSPPAQALSPPAQALSPPAQALSPPAQALSPPAQAFNPPVQAPNPSVQEFSPPAQAGEKLGYVSEQLPRYLGDALSRAIGQRISVGFHRLDEAIGGGLRNGIHIVMAPPGAGKTTWVLQVMDNVISHGHEVIFFSAEMAYGDILSKILSRHSLALGTPMDANEILALGQRKDGDEIAEMLAKTYLPYAQHTIIVPRERIDSAETIEHIVGDYCQRIGKKPVVIIDYLQILAAKFPQGTDKQSVDVMLTKIGDVASKHGVAVLLICSINRDSYSKKMTLGSGKDSGTIEYAAETIMALDYTDSSKGSDYWAQNPGLPREISVHLLKNRFGPLGAKIDMRFYAKYNFFEEVNHQTRTVKF
jgi:replicative DNA helicase